MVDSSRTRESDRDSAITDSHYLTGELASRPVTTTQMHTQHQAIASSASSSNSSRRYNFTVTIGVILVHRSVLILTYWIVAARHDEEPRTGTREQCRNMQGDNA
jgi:hypothetical protein